MYMHNYTWSYLSVLTEVHIYNNDRITKCLSETPYDVFQNSLSKGMGIQNNYMNNILCTDKKLQARFMFADRHTDKSKNNLTHHTGSTK